MGVPASRCPGENELVDYVAHGPDSAAIEPHLDDCAACRATVAQLLDLASAPGGPIPTLPLPAEEPGALLPSGARAGRYVVLELVGAGAMGTVYAARDPDLERTVALKLLRPELGRGPRADGLRVRLAREAKALARISHPNVITVLDTGAIGDQLFVAMELVSGGTLRAWLHEAPRSWRSILGAYRDAGSGLAAAHAAGIVHRDFKPDNVLVGADGRVRVTDFGLSLADWEDRESVTMGETPIPPAQPVTTGETPPVTHRGSLTATGALVGTPVYMAPEQLAGRGADARSDLFSFCVALYEGLYGHRPFAGETMEELRRSSAEPVPASPAGTKVPPWIRRVLLRGLSPDPAARYPSMKALLDALARDPASARRRLWVGALGVALLGAAAVSGWFMSARARAPLCEGSAEKLAGVWDAARRDSVQRAFAATGLPYADDTWKATARALDGWARAFAAMHRDACLATRVRGEQSEDLLGKRMACLERRLDGTRATVDLLLRADAGIVERAVQMTESLPRLAECGDTTALLAPIASPPPEAAGRVLAARRQLDEAAAGAKAGRYEEALRVAQAALDGAKALGYAPLLAEAHLRVGIEHSDLGHPKPAAEAFLEATLAAEAAHDDALAASAWTWQVRALAYDSRFEDAHRAARHAAALLTRVGGGADRDADLESSLGLLLQREGRFADVAPHYQRVLELREHDGASGFALASAHVDLGLAARGDGDLARAEAEERLAVRLYTEALGPDHPSVLAARRELATTLTHLGRSDEAIVELRALEEPCQQAKALASTYCASIDELLGAALMEVGRAEEALPPILHGLVATEAESGPDDRRAARFRGLLGDVYLQQGRVEDAAAEVEHALRIDEASLGPAHVATALARGKLGFVRVRQGRLDEAIELMRRSLDDQVKTLGPDHFLLAYGLDDLGDAYRVKGRLVDALASYERAIALLEKSSPEHTTIASPLTGMGRVLIAQGATDRAVAPLEQALALLQKSADPQKRATTELALADALWKSGGDRRRARSLAEAAETDDEHAGHAGARELPAVRAWLAAHATR